MLGYRRRERENRVRRFFGLKGIAWKATEGKIIYNTILYYQYIYIYIYNYYFLGSLSKQLQMKLKPAVSSARIKKPLRRKGVGTIKIQVPKFRCQIVGEKSGCMAGKKTPENI